MGGYGTWYTAMARPDLFAAIAPVCGGGMAWNADVLTMPVWAFHGTADNVVVPDLAIVKQAGSGDRYVYVYKDGKVSYNKVELGRRMGSEYELKSGVPDNSQVVVAGQARLINGTEVEIEK